MDQRLEILEVAATRPGDILRFYEDNLVKSSGHWLLRPNAPKEIVVFYRGRLKSYDPNVLLIHLAGKTGKRHCGNSICLNPEHML